MRAAEQSTFKARVRKGLVWLGTGTFIGQFISWLSTIIVIRLLLPSDYGLMAMAVTFTGLLTSLSELGVGAAIVQAEEIQEKQIRQIFGFVLITCLAGLTICYAAAPLISQFYNERNLVALIRTLAVNFILIALYVIPESLLIREMDFKTKAKVDISAQIGSSGFTLIFAWLEWGVWSLVLGTIVLHLTKAVLFNRARSVRLKPIFHFQDSVKFIKYGVTVTGGRLLYALYNVSDIVIVGRFLGHYALGIYSVALTLASIPAEKVLPLVNQISFTSYSRIQNDRERIKKNVLQTSRIIAYSAFPIFWGMAAVAHEALPLILGPKWEDNIAPFQLFCVILPLKALSSILSSTTYAIGDAKVNLINTAVTSIVMGAAFLIGVQYGIVGVCLSWVFAYPVVFLIVVSRNLSVMDIALKPYLSELIFPLSASLLMVTFIYSIKKLILLSPITSLILLISFGMVYYLAMIYLFKKEEYREMKTLFLK